MSKKETGVINETEIGGFSPSFELFYRGYKPTDIQSMEELIHLFLYKTLPTEKELELLIKKISSYRKIPRSLLSIVEEIPLNEPERMLLSVLLSKELFQFNDENMEETTLKLYGTIAPISAYWYHFHTSGKRIETYTGPNDTFGSNLLSLTTQKQANNQLVSLIEKCYIIAFETGTSPTSIFMGRVSAVADSPFMLCYASAICGAFSNKHLNGSIKLKKLIDEIKHSDIEKEVSSTFKID